MTLEIAVFSIDSAIQAAAAGADRIELCENPFDGGTTPSFGTLTVIREKIGIPVFPIIRPRGGDFLYTSDEFDVMKKDIDLCKSLGFKGLVIGLLQADGSIDMSRTAELVERAYPLEVTFHRAFDRAIHPLKALEQVINCGCKRILTSGQVPSAFDAKELLKELHLQANGRIIIMPGSGVRSRNIKELANFTKVTELHSSARQMVPSLMQYHQQSMQEDLSLVSVDTDEIQKMKRALAG